MDVHLPFSVRARHDRLVSVEVRICTEMSASRQNCSSEGLAEWIVPCAFISSHHDDGPLADNESISLFSSIGNAWSGGPFIESAHDLHELASQQDERAPQYEGDAIE